MPPSTSSRMSRPLASMSLRSALDLAQRRIDEALAAEARVDAHHQQQVDLVDHPLQAVDRRRRVEHQARLAAGVADQLQRAVDVRAGVGVEADPVGAGLGKRLRQRIDRLHHQVHVDRHARAVGLSPRACAAPRTPSARRSGWARSGCPSRRSGSSRRRRRRRCAPRRPGGRSRPTGCWGRCGGAGHAWRGHVAARAAIDEWRALSLAPLEGARHGRA